MWRFFRINLSNYGTQQSGAQVRLVSATCATKEKQEVPESSSATDLNDPDVFGTLSADKDSEETPKITRFQNPKIKAKLKDLAQSKVYKPILDESGAVESVEKAQSPESDIPRNIKSHVQKLNLTAQMKTVFRAEDGLKKSEEHDTFGELNPQETGLVDYVGDEGEAKIQAHELALSQPKEDILFYSDKMKLLCSQGKLKEALAVLEEEMPSVAVHPNHYCYRVLIRACAQIGFTPKAFKLYSKMKKSGLVPKPLIYTHLFVACGNCPDKDDGLFRATRLRNELQEKHIPLNVKHYHSMIRAFGRCGKLDTVLELMDEMIASKQPLSTETYNFLLQACISDTQAGFRHAIMVWRRMRNMRIRPDLYSYNLLLRCVKDCSAGDNALLTPLLQEATALPLNLKQKLETLPKPKALPKPTISIGDEFDVTVIKKDQKKVLVVEGKSDEEREAIARSEGDCSSTSLEAAAAHTDLMSEAAPAEMTAPSLLSDIPSRGSVVAISSLDTPEDRLALLGGSMGYLQQMELDRVRPNIKTFTQLLASIPGNSQAEESLLQSMESAGVTPDVTFFNLLIRKRSFRNDDEQARAVMELMSEQRLLPNILTYGCLAIGCRTLDAANDLLHQMDTNGCRPSLEIMETLTRKALKYGRYFYALEMLHKVKKYRLQPNRNFIQMVEDGRVRAFSEIRRLEKMSEEGEQLSRDDQHYVDTCRLFVLEYGRFLRRSTMLHDQHPWEQFDSRWKADSSSVEPGPGAQNSAKRTKKSIRV